MITGAVGWAVTSAAHGTPPPQIWRTTDAGTAWRDVSPPALAHALLQGSAFVDAARAWLATVPAHPSAGASRGRTPVTIWRTADGGAVWRGTTVTVPFPWQPAFPISLSFPDADHGWFLAHPEYTMNSMPGALFATDDGGASWHEVSQTATGLPLGGNIRFLNRSDGWLVGSRVSTTNKLLYRTTDGGRSWTRQRLPFTGSASGSLSVDAPPRFFSASAGMVAATYVPKSHLSVDFALDVFMTSDAGRSWHQVASVRAGTAVRFVNSRLGWLWKQQPRDTGSTAPVHGALLQTTDGGKGWMALPLAPALAAHLKAGADVVSMDFVSARDGWILVHAPSTAPASQLLVTGDGGKTWRDLSAP